MAKKPATNRTQEAERLTSGGGLSRRHEVTGATAKAETIAERHVRRAKRLMFEILSDKPYEDALASSERALALQPDLADAYFARGHALIGLRRFDEALAALDQAVALDPKHAKAHTGRGRVLKYLSRWDESATAFRLALTLEEDLFAELLLRDVDHIITRIELEEWKKTLSPSDLTDTPGYTGDIPSPEVAAPPPLPMGEAEIIQAAAELLVRVYPEKAVKRALAELAAEAAHETTVRATAAPRLKWNKDNRPDENPAAFAWRAYQAEAKAGTLHRGLIGQEDRPLAVKLANWLRTHPMPEGIDIPTLPEWNTRQLAKLGIAENDDAASGARLRLYEVARTRRMRRPAA